MSLNIQDNSFLNFSNVKKHFKVGSILSKADQKQILGGIGIDKCYIRVPTNGVISGAGWCNSNPTCCESYCGCDPCSSTGDGHH